MPTSGPWCTMFWAWKYFGSDAAICFLNKPLSLKFCAWKWKFCNKIHMKPGKLNYNCFIYVCYGELANFYCREQILFNSISFILPYLYWNGYTHAGVHIVSHFLQYARQQAVCSTVICHNAHVHWAIELRLSGQVDEVIAWQLPYSAWVRTHHGIVTS